ncbi:MAG: prepilin peptidase [Melioribacteraceae bacterium]|nr:prepilin peptidase [Melioribacteraceae bacterium]
MLIVALIGLIFGSFLNNILTYYLEGKIFDFYRSKCNCQVRVLSYIELIPIISWIIQKGHCKVCKTKIAIRYPLIEISSLILSVLGYLIYGASYEFLFIYIFHLSLLLIVVIDYKKLIIPNRILAVMLIVAITKSVFTEAIITSLLSSFILSIMIYLLGLLITKLKKVDSLGFGDVKLVFIITLFSNLLLSSIIIWIGSIIGLIFILIHKYILKINTNSKEYPLGAYISLAAILVTFLEKQIPVNIGNI